MARLNDRGALRNRMITRAFLPMLLLSLASTPAHSADWRLVAIRSTHYGTSLAFLDLSTVTGRNGQVSFWASTYFNRRTRGMNRVSALVTANCTTQAYRFDQIVTLFNQRPLGRWTPRTTSTANPRTNVFDEINSVCGVRDFSIHVSNPEALAAAYFAARRG